MKVDHLAKENEDLQVQVQLLKSQLQQMFLSNQLAAIVLPKEKVSNQLKERTRAELTDDGVILFFLLYLDRYSFSNLIMNYNWYNISIGHISVLFSLLEWSDCSVEYDECCWKDIGRQRF